MEGPLDREETEKDNEKADSIAKGNTLNPGPSSEIVSRIQT
jgi:hypothetical protein